MKVFETSAKGGYNVNQAFGELLNQILLEQRNEKLHKEFSAKYGTLEFKQLNKYIDF